MITIYEMINQDLASEFMGIAKQALESLQEAVERIEASGKSAAAERAKLAALQKALKKLMPRLQMPPVEWQARSSVV